MYKLPYFIASDKEEVLAFVKEHPFAFICGNNADGFPAATQIPVFIDERNEKLYLSGHIMKNTDHHKVLTENNNVLVVFSGASTYVSASWYENKHRASTWNYQSVHLKGTLTFQDEEALMNILKRTTDYFENNPNSGANYTDIEKDYIDKMKNAIIAFEIEIKEMDHVFKLSQNHNEKDYDNIIKELKLKGGESKVVGEIMENRKHKVFKS